MAVVRNVRERSDDARPEAGEYDSWAWSTPLGGVARWAMRIPWLWPTLLTLLFGCYQLDGPELWSWSFAADPVHELIASGSRSNAAEVGHDLMLHYWMAAFGVCLLLLARNLFSAGDQQVIRKLGAHNWPAHPVGYGGYSWDYAGAASIIAGEAKAGDGIIYQVGKVWWLMIGPGLQYYLRRDMPHGVPVPCPLFVTRTAPQSSQIRPVACRHPAACLGDEPRIWIVGGGYQKDPYRAVPAGQAAVLRPRYRLGSTMHFRGLIVFLLVHDIPHGSPA